MVRTPDDGIFGPEEPLGPIIDVTPKKKERKKRSKAGVDFDSDEPIIEQLLKKGGQGPDRIDKTEGEPSSGIIIVAIIVFIIIIASVITYILVR